MSTAASSAAEQAEVNQRFYDLLLNSSKTQGRSMTLGEAAAGAKAATRKPEITSTYILLGDPAMRIR